MKKQAFIILLSSVLFTGCSTTTHKTSSITDAKTLNVPAFENLTKIDTLYIDGANQSYSEQYSVGEDAFKPTYYDLLSDAKYVSKVDSNDVIDGANITLSIYTSDTDKVNYIIYPDGNTYYLEDVTNLDLYTVSKDVFDSIVNNINTSTNVTENNTLYVPAFEDLYNMTMVYTDSSSKSYESSYSTGKDTKKPSYYDLLHEAKYVSKMESNDVIDNENVVLTLWLTKTDKLNYVIYSDGDTYYLEDVTNLDLYTVSSDVFDGIIQAHFNI